MNWLRWELWPALMFFCLWLSPFSKALYASDKQTLRAALQNVETLRAKGDYSAAARECERALALAPRVFGSDALITAGILNNLGLLYENMGSFRQAETNYQRSLKIKEAKLKRDHPEIAQGVENLAILFFKMGDCSRAEP